MEKEKRAEALHSDATPGDWDGADGTDYYLLPRDRKERRTLSEAIRACEINLRRDSLSNE